MIFYLWFFHLHFHYSFTNELIYNSSITPFLFSFLCWVSTFPLCNREQSSLHSGSIPLGLTFVLCFLCLVGWLCKGMLPFRSVQFSRSVVSDSLRPHRLQHTRLPYPPSTPRACSNSCLSSRWCHPTISSSVVPFSSCLLPFSASGSFPVSQFFTLGDQSIGASASASASVLPMNIQDWFLWGLTGLISLQSKGLSRIFSNNTVQKHQFFGAQLSLWSNSHIHTWLLEKP